MMMMMRKDEEEEEKEDEHVVEAHVGMIGDGPSPKRKKMETPAVMHAQAMHEGTDKEVEKGAMHDNMKSDGKEEQEEQEKKEEDEETAAMSDEAGGSSSFSRHD